MRPVPYLLAAALALGASPLWAQSWRGVIKNGPGELFDAEDTRLFSETSDKALNEAPDGQTLSWENPKTRHGGDVTVLRSFEWKGYGCKEVRINNRAQGRQAENNLNWCKVEGKWRLVSEAQLGKN